MSAMAQLGNPFPDDPFWIEPPLEPPFGLVVVGLDVAVLMTERRDWEEIEADTEATEAREAVETEETDGTDWVESFD